MIQKTENKHVKNYLKEDYFVMANEGSVGPLDFEAVKKLAKGGEINEGTLVWKTDKFSWERADSFEELCNLF